MIPVLDRFLTQKLAQFGPVMQGGLSREAVSSGVYTIFRHGFRIGVLI